MTQIVTFIVFIQFLIVLKLVTLQYREYSNILCFMHVQSSWLVGDFFLILKYIQSKRRLVSGGCRKCVRAFISCCLNYCNVLLTGLPKKDWKTVVPLHVIQNVSVMSSKNKENIL